MRGEYHFNHAAFNGVSDQCKDLIRKCLVKDSKKRITALESLKHPWIIANSQTDINSGIIGGSPGSAEILLGINEVWKQGKAKHAVILYLSDRVNPLNIKGLQAALSMKDESKMGELSSE